MKMIVLKLKTVTPKEVVKRIRDAGLQMVCLQDIGITAATTAYQQNAGDISRKEPSLAVFHKETEHFYVGNFVEGFGILEVCFPKSGCRDLTEEEVQRLLRSERVVGPFPAANEGVLCHNVH